MGGFEKYWPLAGSGCLHGARGQRGEVAGSSICRQNSPPSGANGLAELPELPPAQVHMQACACPVARNPQAFRNIACMDVHWPAAFCICLLVFYPPRDAPPASIIGGKHVPRVRTATLTDSREFGGRGASKTALPLSLSSKPTTSPQKLSHFYLR